MAGTSTGYASVSLIGARVTRPCTFVPGYQKPDGNKVNAKIYIPVAINTLNGEVSYFQLTAWGDKIASLFAHYLRKGKEMHFIDARLTTFKWQMTTKEGTPVTNNDGTPLMFDRPSIVVTQFLWGSDSNDIIQADEQQAMLEVSQGLRGPNWKVPGHPDNIAWKAREKARVSQPYQGGPTFGYADVSKRSLQAQAQNAYLLAGNAGMMANAVNMAQPGGMPSINPATVVASNATAPNVGGVTYEQLIGAGWNEAQIMADPRYAVLKTAHDAMVKANAGRNAGIITPPPPPATAPTTFVNPGVNPAMMFAGNEGPYPAPTSF